MKSEREMQRFTVGKPIRRSGGEAARAHGCAHVGAVSRCAAAVGLLGLLAGCGDPGNVDTDIDPDIVASAEQEFMTLNPERIFLIPRVNAGSTIRVCLKGSYVTAARRPSLETQITDAIMTWVDAARGAAVGALINRSAISFLCVGEDLGVLWSNFPGGAVATTGPEQLPYIELFSDDGYGTVLHEVGHVFGMDDTYIPPGAVGCFPGQPDSQMCVSSPAFLRPDDIRGIRERYCMAFPSPAQCKRRAEANTGWCAGSGAHLLVGDINADGRDDLLCHNSSNGNKWIDYASATGRFGGTDASSSLGWCGGSGDRLYVGDFNGDARDDMLCHNPSKRLKWIDYADTLGRYGGTDWSSGVNWCDGSSDQLLVDDFNLDGREDLLCHSRANGTKWIDYADASGRFGATDWTAALGWCASLNDQLFLGDFNADGRGDMLCHNTSSGHKFIDYADASGRFGGTDWSAALGWCSQGNADIHVGDFNDDGRDDMLCHDRLAGSKWVAIANASGQFTGTTWYWQMGWCNSSGQFLVGDFEGNGSTDFLCHHTASGYKWQAFQLP